jgi:hypothetical protein
MGLASVLVVLAMLLAGLAAFIWPLAFEPWRGKLIAGALFCYFLSLLVNAGLKL